MPRALDDVRARAQRYATLAGHRRDLMVQLGRIEVALASADGWEEAAYELPAAVRQRLMARLPPALSRESLVVLRKSVLEQLAELETASS